MEVNQLVRKKRRQIFNLQSRSLVSMNNPKSMIAEQYRTIRTNIEFASIDCEIKTIVITSAEPGDGKSTTAANLAIVFAQQGKRVLLIDSDLRKPTAHYTFKVDNKVGLTNVLTKQYAFSEAITVTEDSKLYLLPSGPIPPNPSEMLGSEGMKNLLEEAKEQFDVILLETPPILAVTDAQVLSNLAEGAIFVVNSGKTEVDKAKKAKEQLVNTKVKLLGAVLNNKKQKDNQYYYGGKQLS